MLAVHQAEDLRAQLPRAVVVAVDPGWVKTRMGGDGAVMQLADSIAGMLELLHGLTDEDNGGCFNYDGTQKPW